MTYQGDEAMNETTFIHRPVGLETTHWKPVVDNVTSEGTETHFQEMRPFCNWYTVLFHLHYTTIRYQLA